MGQVERRLTLADIRIDESMWGEGAEPLIRDWVVEHYDERTMPSFAAAQIVGREGFWLLGWNHEGTPWPPLMELIFGKAYSEKRLALNEMGMRLTDLLEEGHGEYGAAPDGKEDQ